MGLRSLGLYRALVALAVIGLWQCPRLSAAPDTTMTIAPSATSGATITASDENDRNNDVSSAYNSHSHTDISSTTANSFTFGDAAAGNKNLCANAADTTDACIRWNDTANLWTVDNPTPGTFNQIATISGTSGINGILIGDGTGSLTALSGINSGTAQIAQSGSSPLIGLTLGDDSIIVGNAGGSVGAVKIPDCADSNGSHLNYSHSGNGFNCGTSAVNGSAPFVGTASRNTATASGTQAITGVGFAPRACIFNAGQDTAAGEFSFGFDSGGGGSTSINFYDRHNTTASTWGLVNSGESIHDQETSTEIYTGTITTLGPDGFTITWTRTSTPTGTLSINYICFD